METKIAVLGLGPSLKDFNPADFKLSIGVNDIWRYVKSEVVACFNQPSNFTYERMQIINDCKPQAFYSQIVNYDTRPDFVKIDILPGYPDNFCNLDLKEFYKSYCSPFIAVQIAYRFYEATEIHLFGVDLTNHLYLNRKLCEKIKLHFCNLKIALLDKNCIFVVHGEGILKNL